MIKIDNTIKDALRKAIEANGSALELSRKCYVSNTAFTRYLSGEIPEIKPSTWSMLAPYLEPHLPDGYVPVGSNAMTLVKVKNSDSMIKYAKVILNDPDLGDDKKVMILKLYFNEK